MPDPNHSHSTAEEILQWWPILVVLAQFVFNMSVWKVVQELKAIVHEIHEWKAGYTDNSSWGTAAGVREWRGRHNHEHRDLNERVHKLEHQVLELQKDTEK